MHRTLLSGSLLTACLFLGAPPPARAQADAPEDVEALRRQVGRLQQTVEHLQHTLEQLQQAPSRAPGGPPPGAGPRPSQPAAARRAPLEQALAELEGAEAAGVPARRGLWSQRLGTTAHLRLIDIAADVLFFAGGSSERDAAITTLQGGSHDPKHRGFTLGQAEFSLSGAVDPYVTGAAYVLTSVNPQTGETTLELEEASFTSAALPYGLQVEGGHFLTEFGRINPQHPHAWDWIDQPVVNARLFGGDGMRQAGVRVSWLPPTPWYSEVHVGLQNADGATMASFLGGELTHSHGSGHGDAHGPGDEAGHADEHGPGDEAAGSLLVGDGIAGRPIVTQDVRGLGDFVYLTRWESAVDVSDEVTVAFGLSGLYGPNATGRAADTWLYGLDMKWRWQPPGNFGSPFLTWQTEVLKRDYHAARYTEATATGEVATLPGRTLKDWGFYTQVLHGFRTGWAAGLRYEYAGGSGQSLGGRQHDPFRADRHRLSPLVVWRPSEFSRLRLQYNYDVASHLQHDAHTLWLGLEWVYGAHAAHTF